MLRNGLKAFYNKFLSPKGSPHFIAISFALGIAIGYSPIIGTHTILTSITSLALRLNMAVMYLATWIVCNPLTAVPVIFAEYRIGRVILLKPRMVLPQAWSFQTIIHLSWDVLGPIIVGWSILAVISAPISYVVVRYTIRNVRGSANGNDHV